MSSFVANNNQDHRYSRQSYTIGQDAQTKLSGASVLIIGYNSLAQEIIRNLALIGVAKINIFNTGQLENYQKTSLYYPITTDNSIPIEQLSKLNPTIQISQVNILDEDNDIDKKQIKKYNLVVLTNCVIEDALNINRITHKLNIPFIMTGCYGLMGYLFNDFGEKYVVNDIDGENSEPLILDSIESKTLKFKDSHNLADGDIITITWSDPTQDPTQYTVYRKRSPVIIELTEMPNQDKSNYVKILRNKISKTFEFKPLKKNIDDITHVIADWSVDMDRSKHLHKLHLAYDKYLSEYKQAPRSWSLADYEVFQKYLKSDSEQEFNDDFYKLAKKFCYTLKGDLLPVISIIGGVVSHEILKALAHKYIPITQWYYMDSFDLISDNEIEEFNDPTGKNFRTKTKYEGIVNIFGKKFLEQIQNTVPFVVGSGAIGCELVKNLGMMGIQQIWLTDPDHIEKSNLSRQFLFNDGDIRQSKAETAGKKIKLMNPDTTVRVLKQKICSETENIFNESFHSKIDIYLNALDNVDARIYMDSIAIKYSKPLIDSGTMGSKGNVQVILPYLTESYGSTKDPDEKSGIPICTIKSFPYKPEHTIQWARELFETEFNQIPSMLDKYKSFNELSKLNDSDAKNLLKLIYKYDGFKLTFDGYLILLGTIFYENHYDNIKEIIDKYTKADNKEELGDKKLPIYLNQDNSNFSPINWLKYILEGFNLLNQMFQTKIEPDQEQILKLFNVDSTRMIFPYDTYDMDNLNSEEIIQILNNIANQIPKTIPIEFDKDDDDLGHVQWITSSANMRNTQYSIPESDIYDTRRIAGNIIPAMITTTSLISGYQILEFIKICKFYSKNKISEEINDKVIDLYKNRFVNLNINYLDGITPTKATKYNLTDGNNISVWTNYTVSSYDTSVIIEQLENQTKKKIEFITSGDKTVYDGDNINIQILTESDANNILILLEDIPMGIPVFIK